MSSKRYRGRFVWQPPENLSFEGSPQNRDQWFELSRQQLLTMWRDFKGLPIRQLHGSVPIGRVLTPFWDADGSAMIEFEFDNTPEATFTRSLLENNLMRGLSLKHNPNSTYPIEISLCFEGARPNTWVTQATETKDATYKPTDTFIPMQHQSLELLAETTSTPPVMQQANNVSASMQQIPMQGVAQSVAQGQAPVGGYVPPPGIADPMYQQQQQQQQQQQPPPQQQQQQQPPPQQPPPVDADIDMPDIDAEVPVLDEILKAIVEKNGPLSAKEKVLLLKSHEKTKRQVETATSELQEQQQQNNQLKSHYLDAIVEWMKRSSGSEVNDDDRQRLNKLLSSPEGTQFIASSTGNRFLVSAHKSAPVPDFKTKEQLEEERYESVFKRMMQQTQAPGTSVTKSVSASSGSKPSMPNVQASSSIPFTPEEFKHAFSAPLRVVNSGSTGNQQPVRPYLPNVSASGSSGAPPARTFYTSEDLGWRFVPKHIKIPAFAKELIQASRTNALDQVDMMVTVPPRPENRSALFGNRFG